MSRYMERAEDITRILTINFNALLDLPDDDAEKSWESIITITGDEESFNRQYRHFDAHNVMEFLLWNDKNPNSVLACVSLARENARTVREQISSEMWEQINRLYFLVTNVDQAKAMRSPTEFFAQIRDGSHAFQGVTHATLTHAEGYHFIQLGKHIERSDKTARILDVKYAAIHGLEEGSPVQTIQLTAMLKSCSAMEAYRKFAKQLQAWRVVEFLLLNAEFPRSVLFCAKSCHDALDRLSGGIDAKQMPLLHLPLRTFGRLCADLQFLDIRDVIGESLHAYLDQLIARLNAAGDEISRGFFSAQIILPGSRTYLQQVQQQQ
jgi:uncharacterized alpha-E superfamily protein